MARPVRLAFGLVPLLEVLAEHGHACAPLLATAEIPLFAIEEPSYHITLSQELAFTRRALAALRSPQAGLSVGQRFDLPMFGLLGLAATCAPSMRRMLQTIMSYPALAWGVIEVGVWRTGEDELIAFKPNGEVGDLAPYFVERDSAAIVALFRGTLGAQVVPTRVSFSHFPPADCARYDSYFGCRVEFSAAVDEIWFAPTVWDAEPPRAHSLSHRFFTNQCRQLGATLEGPFNHTEVVRARLRTATPMPSLSALAGTLQLTARTLQRRLAAEGIDFSTLLHEVRAQRAQELLRRGHLHIDAIAYRLGFKDPAAFSRAFKQWTSQSPSTYRRG